MSQKVVDAFIARYGRLPTEFDKDYLEMLRMSKYIVQPVPMTAPGKCANCGASKNDGRMYVDFGLQIDWYGALHICGLCIRDVAETLELFTPLRQELLAVREAAVAREFLVSQGTDLKETFLSIFEEVKTHFDDLHSAGNDTTLDPSPVPDDVVPSPSEGTKEAKSGTTESTSVSRSKNLPSLAELLESSS
jgi:hypothetical protein